jgi:hypothetical protein
MSKSRDSRVVALLLCRPSLGSTGTFTHRTRSRRPGERLGTPDETLDQDANALLGDIVGRERPVSTIPPCDPAERTRDGECCECLVGARRLALVMRERLCHFEQALIAAALHFFRDPEV